MKQLYISGEVKLSNYSIYRRLSDLHSNEPCIYGKKTDIFKYGLFILSLVQGKSLSEESIKIPNSIPSDLYDFLKRYNICILFNSTKTSMIKFSGVLRKKNPIDIQLLNC